MGSDDGRAADQAEQSRSGPEEGEVSRVSVIEIFLCPAKPPFVFSPAGGKAALHCRREVLMWSSCPLRGKDARQDRKGAHGTENAQEI